jgi:hypothetical protein
METIIEKISESEVKEIVPQPNDEIVHNLNGLVKRREEALEQLEIDKKIIDDFDVLIKKVKQVGCTETLQEDIPVI